MLLMKQKPNQVIIINSTVKIYNLGFNAWGQIKFGIEAPKDINIVRKEIIGKPLKPPK